MQVTNRQHVPLRRQIIHLKAVLRVRLFLRRRSTLHQSELDVLSTVVALRVYVEGVARSAQVAEILKQQVRIGCAIGLQLGSSESRRRSDRRGRRVAIEALPL